MIVTIGDDCCSGALVLKGVSTTTFLRLPGSSNGVLVSLAVARWFKDLFVGFISFAIVCTPIDTC
jgi:hypothetical protein